MSMTGNDLAKKFREKFNSDKDKLSTKDKPGNKHLSYEVYHDGKKVIPFVMFSHGTRTLGPRIIGLIGKQLGLKSNNVKGIESCTFYGKDFVEKSTKL